MGWSHTSKTSNSSEHTLSGDLKEFYLKNKSSEKFSKENVSHEMINNSKKALKHLSEHYKQDAMNIKDIALDTVNNIKSDATIKQKTINTLFNAGDILEPFINGHYGRVAYDAAYNSISNKALGNTVGRAAQNFINVGLVAGISTLAVGAAAGVLDPMPKKGHVSDYEYEKEKNERKRRINSLKRKVFGVGMGLGSIAMFGSGLNSNNSTSNNNSDDSSNSNNVYANAIAQTGVGDY